MSCFSIASVSYKTLIVGGLYFSQYLLTTIEGALVDLLSFGLMRPKAIYGKSPPSSIDPTRAVRLAIQRLCQELIPETIGLTDAFGFTDWDLDRSLTLFSIT